MLTKAFIQEIINPYSLRIRIPSINKIEGVNGATPNSELYVAAVCASPNLVTNAHVGDVVILGFEDNDVSKPIVLGHLSNSKDSDSMVSMRCEEFKALGDVRLSKDTTIGDVTSENIECLKNQKDNISDAFKLVRKSIKDVEKSVDELSTSSHSNKTSIENLNSSIEGINTTLGNIITALSDLTTKYGELDSKFDNYLNRYAPIFVKGKSYGTDVSEVNGPLPGQLYLTIKDDD